MRLASRHYCPLRASVVRCVGVTSGKGPASGKCKGCGAPLTVEQGLHGVYLWRGDGRYRAVDALALCFTEAHAQRVADRETTARPDHRGGVVVRWVTASDLEPSTA